MNVLDLILLRRRPARRASATDFYAETDTQTAVLPPVPYEPHGIDTPEKLAEIRAQAEAGARAAQESAQTEAWGERDEPAGPAPLVPAHEPPPMPPSGLSRIMVAQIPPPPPNDRNFEWTHQYADYMRRVGVATGTSTDLEHTMAWGMPALEPGDGTGGAAVSTATIGLTTAEAEAIARARAALGWVGSDDFPWPAFGSGAIKMHAAGLRESLDDHANLTATPPRAHPADLFPGLGRGQDNALELALNLVTQDIREWTRELVRLGNKAEEAYAAEEAARALAEGRAA